LSGFLLDTNVVSKLAPSRTNVSDRFLQWLALRDSEGTIFLSVVTIHEIERGIAILEHKRATAKAASLRIWLAGLVSAYDDKILPVDVPAAALSGQLEAKALFAGADPGMADATIAGIAKAHDLVIVTANAKHFLPFGVAIVSPDEVAP
jgi:predicted nucleic acid-binding protein